MSIIAATRALNCHQGTWVWLADHDLDGDGSLQLSLFSGRGILSESVGPVWMIGTGMSVMQVSEVT